MYKGNILALTNMYGAFCENREHIYSKNVRQYVITQISCYNHHLDVSFRDQSSPPTRMRETSQLRPIGTEFSVKKKKKLPLHIRRVITQLCACYNHHLAVSFRTRAPHPHELVIDPGSSKCSLSLSFSISACLSLCHFIFSYIFLVPLLFYIFFLLVLTFSRISLLSIT